MARLPVPRSELTRPEGVRGRTIGPVPAPVLEVIEVLRAGGHAAYLVGGSLRDLLTGREPSDWDLASDARPERIVELFPGSVYENRFGTVAVRRAHETFEITTFRRDHDYADFRRPHRVEFGETIEVDLARRDFTVNAMAWGGRPGAALGLEDPHSGLADLDQRLLRAVGEPEARFGEDALRMVRAIRLGDDPRVHHRAANAGRDRSPGRARPPPLRRADRRRAGQGPRGPAAVARTATARDDRLAGLDRPRARRPAGRAPEQGTGRGSLGSHGPFGRRRCRRPAGRSPGRPGP